MDLESFRQSLKSSQPPAGLAAELKALWYDAKGEWERAHETVQDLDTRDAAWVHAYLHRKEGDRGNASYWYSRGRQSFSNVSLEEEWAEIVQALLEK